MNSDLIKKLVLESAEKIPDTASNEEQLSMFIREYTALLVNECVDVCTSISANYIAERELTRAGAAGFCGHKILEKFEMLP
jgi:hypothetical protein